DFHLLAALDQQLTDDAAYRGWNFLRSLVRLQFEDRLVRLHRVTGLLVDFADLRLGDGFARRGHGHLHEPAVSGSAGLIDFAAGHVSLPLRTFSGRASGLFSCRAAFTDGAKKRSVLNRL